jgi:phage protein D
MSASADNNWLPNPHAVVEIDGVKFDSWDDARPIIRVRTELVTEHASEGSVELVDTDFAVLDSYSLADGVKRSVVRVWFGYGESVGEPVFKGMLARIDRGDETTTLVAYDMGYKMRLEKRAQYNKGTDLDILKKLAERNGLTFEGPDKGFKAETHKSRMQDQQTDWQHACQLARDAGLVLFVREDTLFAKEPAKTGTPVVKFTRGGDFATMRGINLGYKLPENKGGRPRRAEHRTHGKHGKAVKGVSDESKRGHVHVEMKRDVGAKTLTGAQRRAAAIKAQEREHAFTCRVRARLDTSRDRRPDVRETAELSGVGKLFGGLYLIDQVTHELSARGLHTDYQLYRDVKEG